MKGTVLKFNKEDHTGIISGYDGKRYKFNTQNLEEDNVSLLEGVEVDFEPKGLKATEIFVIKMKIENRQKTTALLLAFFLGGFGVHHFYLGKTMAGVLSLLFFWTFIPAIVAFINLIQIASMNEQKFNENYNQKNK